MATPRAVLALAAASIWLATFGHAQDVTGYGPIALEDGPPGSQPPLKGAILPHYPVAMRQAPEFGYVFVIEAVEAKGWHTQLETRGSHDAFENSVENTGGRTPLSKGKDEAGEPRLSLITYIFNPAGAPADGDSARPRLLAAFPAFTPEAEKSGRITMRLKLDVSGAILEAQPVDSAPDGLVQAARKALEHWRFAPAREHGVPIPADVQVAVLCLARPNAKSSKFEPPKPIDRPPPVYPFAMRRFGINGEVTIDFIVAPNGAVKNPYVSSSNSRTFEEPAIAAVRKWRFKPAQRDGRPVAARMQVPIIFSLAEGGEDAFTIDERDQSKLPPELRYDTPPKIRNVQLPIFPYELRRDGVRGKAAAVMLIGTNGRVENVKVVSASRPEFGEALAAAVSTFRFHPAAKAGKPVPHLLRFEHKFEPDPLDSPAYELLRVERTSPADIPSAAKCDERIAPISQRPPVFPPRTLTEAESGRAVIECVIDEDGRAQLPRIVEATSPAFGYAAAQAIDSWFFQPPRINGKPAAVRIRVPVQFSPPKPKQERPAKTKDSPPSEK